MKCCGNEVTTPFCPMCGEARAGQGPLYEMLDHVRNQLRRRKGRQRNISPDAPVGHPSHAGIGELEKLKHSIAKWEKWETALLEAIDAKESNP